MTTDEMIAVLVAAKQGKRIQAKSTNSMGGWTDCPFPSWDFRNYEYRVKPTPWYVILGFHGALMFSRVYSSLEEATQAKRELLEDGVTRDISIHEIQK